MAKPLLSVVIPSFNEAENFRAGKLEEVYRFLKAQSFSWEVIVVDDGSTDQTPDLVSEWIKNKPHWRLIKNPHAGKGPTVATGMQVSTGRIRLFTDFDQATPISESLKVIEKINQGADVVICSRELPDSQRVGEPLLRHIMGRVFNFIVQSVALRGISDSQCGFKAFSQTATTQLFPKLLVYRNRRVSDAYMGAFDVELLFLARKKGFKIAQIPVTWTYVNTSRVNAIKDSIRMTHDILLIRLYHLTGQYQ